MSSDRDRILEQALKHELRAAGTPPAGACLDAETLGAWTDGALDAAAMAAAEAHVSNCARCQALIGTMVRATPSTAGTQGTLGTLGTPGTPGTLSLWKWWLAPIAAGVTAVTLWMVVPEQPQLAGAPPRPEAAQAARSRILGQSVPPAAAEKSKDAPLDQFAEQVPKRDDNLAAAARDDRQQNKLAEPRKEESLARQVPATPALADAAVPSAAPAAAIAAAPGTIAESVTVQPRENAASAPVDALQKSARAAAAIDIATLDPAIGWRIAGDRIERSEDAGRTWRVTRQNPADSLTAGSAPSNNVCWFVGRGGRVLLTADGGATFRDVSLAEPLDLASVAAIDFRSAMIYSVIGRRFRTEDSGRSWRPF